MKCQDFSGSADADGSLPGHQSRGTACRTLVPIRTNLPNSGAGQQFVPNVQDIDIERVMNAVQGSVMSADDMAAVTSDGSIMVCPDRPPSSRRSASLALLGMVFAVALSTSTSVAQTPNTVQLE